MTAFSGPTSAASTPAAAPGLGRCLGALAAAAGALLLGDPAQAQSERFLLGPGSRVGPATQVEPQNCVTAADGAITCDTKLVNPEGTTPAKPIFDPFKN